MIHKDDFEHDARNDWVSFITNVDHNDHTELVNKKTYRRLWLQHYYNKSRTKIEFNKNSFSVNKTASISGFLELALRSFIPMFLFKEIVSRHKIDYSFHDIMRLKDFATMDLINVAYHLSVMELFLKQHTYQGNDLRKHAKLFAAIHVNFQKEELYQKEYNIPFVFKLRKQDLFFDESQKHSKQTYFFSIFKAIAFFVVSLKKIEKISSLPDIHTQEDIVPKDIHSFKKLFEQFRSNLPCENCDSFVQQSLDGMYENKYFDQLLKIQNFELKNSELGILECMKFSKNLVRFFYDIRANTNLKDNFSSLNYKLNVWEYNQQEKNYNFKREYKGEAIDKESNLTVGEGTLSPYFTFPLSAYITGFSQALLISLVDSQPDIKNIDIYTINSFHGANLTLLKKMQLSKKSSAFISNITTLLKIYAIHKNIDTKQYPLLDALISEEEYSEQLEDHQAEKIGDILAFYENFLSINFFNLLVEQFDADDITENCDFLSKDVGCNDNYTEIKEV